MTSEYIKQCSSRAFESIQMIKNQGLEPKYLEISSDIWAMINIGGINMFPGKKIFAGLEVIERDDLTDHIQVIAS